MANIIPTKKIYLEEAIAEFGLTNMHIIRALKTLLMYSEYDDIPIYIEPGMCGVRTDTEFAETYCIDGSIDKIEIVNGDVEAIGDPKSIKSAFAHTSLDGTRIFINVSIVRFNHVDYYLTDETSLWLDSESFDLDDLYFDRDELLPFLVQMDKSTRIHGRQLEEESKKVKPLSVNVKREVVFKTWLATKADLKIKDDSDYNQCYAILGSETQETIWGHLQKIDQKLFSCGKDEFFRKQKIIQFKMGSGNGRNQ